ncbi:hypothetical protein OBV_p-00620 (plasmid) [Oscillibacter valericigenes Sjm18-20]|nr:hypothetical protein OBV_p-00620 [Oscillibacter valericigenes Sjm18-20]
MNILSIDYDYFVKVSEYFRENHFPDGGREQGDNLNLIVWSQLYASGNCCGERIETIISDNAALRKIRKFIARQKNPVCMIADSHSHAYNFIKDSIPAGEKATVYNIDFHHDTFCINDENEVNCGNWLRHLLDEKVIDRAYWVAKPDSETDGSLVDIIPIEKALEVNYDAVYICRSSWWTPPHLDGAFTSELVKPLLLNKRGWAVRYEKNIDVSRYNKEFQDAVASFTEVYKMANEKFRERSGE